MKRMRSNLNNNLFGSFSEQELKEQLKQRKVHPLGYSTMITNKVSGAFSIFSGKKEEVQQNLKKKDDSSEKIMKEEESKIKLLKEDQDSDGEGKHKRSKSLPKEKKEDKISEYSDPSDAEIHLKKALKKENYKLKAIFDRQITKWKSIQYKREKEDQLLEKIKKSEVTLEEATKKEDYDKAYELQTKINLLNNELNAKKSNTFKLEDVEEGDFDSIQENYLKSLKDNTYNLFVAKSKLSTHKAIYHKAEKEKIREISKELESQELRLDSNSKSIEKQLAESEEKLKDVEEEINLKAKSHIEERIVLDKEITTVDSEIAELEKQLKIKLDRRHALEDKRTEKNRVIREITSELDGKENQQNIFSLKILVNFTH